jgi:hypothetical protein
MGSLQYAKESILTKTIQDIAENDKRTQTLDVMGSAVWKGKSVALTGSLSDALLNNTKLTALNLSQCNLGDGAVCKLADAIQYNNTLFELDLSNNKLGRPGLTHLAKCLTDNTGLINLDLIGHRINSEVAAAFVEMFQTNMTLCKLIWKLEVGRAACALACTPLSPRTPHVTHARHLIPCTPPPARIDLRRPPPQHLAAEGTPHVVKRALSACRLAGTTCASLS